MIAVCVTSRGGMDRGYACDCLISESMPRGGKRKGAGRPRGSKDPHTLEREAVQAAFNQRVLNAADRLFHAQLAQAEGVTFLFKKPKTGKERKTERVTDAGTIRRFFDGELDDSETDWYFVAGERPNSDAADRLLNRAFGKAPDKHTVDIPQLDDVAAALARKVVDEFHPGPTKTPTT